MSDIDDAINQLESDIKIKQQQIEQLRQLDPEKTLSEEEYHDLCLTDLRHSDILGQQILNNFPFLKYEGWGANYFNYAIGNSDIRICLPNSETRCIEIYMLKYYASDDVVEKQLQLRYLEKETELDNDLKICLTLIAQKSLIKRAKMLFLHNTTIIAVIRYMITDPYMQYQIRFLDTLDCIEREIRQQNQKKEADRIDLHEKHIQQQELLKPYIESFLKWTKCVHIYDHSRGDKLSATIELDASNSITYHEI